MTSVPMPAVVELVERHTGPKYDARELVRPNLLRINGIPVWAPQKDPVILHEYRVDGAAPNLFVVTIALQVRRLVADADAPPTPPIVIDLRDRQYPLLSMVDLATAADTELADGQPIPYDPALSVRVNGEHLLLAHPGPVVERTVVAGTPPEHSDAIVCRVRLPLVCRRFVVDDEPEDSGPPAGVFPQHPA